MRHLMSPLDFTTSELEKLFDLASEIEKNPKKITIITRVKEGKVEIIFSDNGEGITLENQKRLFEPFFTTKEKGVGLGMSIVHRIIEAHHGTIDVKSERERGTQFTILLPRHQEDAEEKAV